MSMFHSVREEAGSDDHWSHHLVSSHPNLHGLNQCHVSHSTTKASLSQLNQPSTQILMFLCSLDSRRHDTGMINDGVELGFGLLEAVLCHSYDPLWYRPAPSSPLPPLAIANATQLTIVTTGVSLHSPQQPGLSCVCPVSISQSRRWDLIQQIYVPCAMWFSCFDLYTGKITLFQGT